MPKFDPYSTMSSRIAFLKDPRKPRWVAKPTVAYLWARTVFMQAVPGHAAPAQDPLAVQEGQQACPPYYGTKLRSYLCRTFAVQPNVPQNGGNTAQRREHDKRIGAGTMSRTGATCPCCGAIMTMSDIRYEGTGGAFGRQL